MSDSATATTAPAEKVRKPRAPRKPSVLGFVIIDSLTNRPLVFKHASLLEVADEATFFEIVSTHHGEGIKTSPRTIEYQTGRRKAEKALEKHYRNLAKLQGSAMTNTWDKVLNAQKLKPKVMPVRNTPAVPATA